MWVGLLIAFVRHCVCVFVRPLKENGRHKTPKSVEFMAGARHALIQG